MKRLLLAFMVVGLMLGLLASFTAAAPVGVTAKDAMKELAAARRATRQYQNAELPAWDGLAGGYAQVSPSIPGMGYHYVNSGLLDPFFDAAAPEILLYADAGDGSGRRLIGVEYAVVGPPFGPPGPPEGFTGDDDVWELHEAACHYTDETEEPCDSPADADPGKTLALWHPGMWALHVWLWQGNPDGVFEAFNPNIP